MKNPFGQTETPKYGRGFNNIPNDVLTTKAARDAYRRCGDALVGIDRVRAEVDDAEATNKAARRKWAADLQAAATSGDDIEKVADPVLIDLDPIRDRVNVKVSAYRAAGRKAADDLHAALTAAQPAALPKARQAARDAQEGVRDAVKALSAAITEADRTMKRVSFWQSFDINPDVTPNFASAGSIPQPFALAMRDILAALPDLDRAEAEHADKHTQAEHRRNLSVEIMAAGEARRAEADAKPEPVALPTPRHELTFG